MAGQTECMCVADFDRKSERMGAVTGSSPMSAGASMGYAPDHPERIAWFTPRAEEIPPSVRPLVEQFKAEIERLRGLTGALRQEFDFFNSRLNETQGSMRNRLSVLTAKTNVLDERVKYLEPEPCWRCGAFRMENQILCEPCFEDAYNRFADAFPGMQPSSFRFEVGFTADVPDQGAGIDDGIYQRQGC